MYLLNVSTTIAYKNTLAHWHWLKYILTESELIYYNRIIGLENILSVNQNQFITKNGSDNIISIRIISMPQ